jgi:hypothetical protein
MAIAAQTVYQQRITTFVREEFHNVSPEATTMCSFAK